MSNVHFTALIRLPFARGDFVDPQQATWDATKDRKLWTHISKSSKSKDLDWVRLASEFQVPPAFLLQQAAWLYERHLDHVRAQMKKVGGQSTATSGVGSLGNTQATASTVAAKRLSIGSGVPKTSSTLVSRSKDGPAGRGDAGTPAPPLSRTPSTNTITQSRALGQQGSVRSSFPPHRQTQDAESHHLPPEGLLASDHLPQESENNSPADPASPSSSSSLSNSGSDNLPTRSQLFKRPPRFQSKHQPDLLAFDEEDDGPDEPIQSASSRFPFPYTGNQRQAQDQSSSSRPAPSREQDVPSSTRRTMKPADNSKAPALPTETSSSLASSSSEAPLPGPRSTGPLSPNHRAELARLSPRRGGPRSRKEGSEGTPSMGSSFSDLDDTSISQSALEEALLSNIQHGRMSTLSQLRSRYL